MDLHLLLMTPSEALRGHGERLQRAAYSRQASEVCQRMRIRNRLRKAILEALTLEGSTQELAAEFSGLVRKTERRFSGRSCC